MKVYSDTLTTADLHKALPQGVHMDALKIKSPRVRARGWIVQLGSYGGNRWKNSGKHGAAGEKAASWDQHGEWMAVLFDRDPNARIAYYDGAEEFHRMTEGKFERVNA